MSGTVIQTSGSLRYRQRLATDTPSDPSSCSLSPLRPVCAPFPLRPSLADANVRSSGPRFALVGLFYLLTAKPGRVLPKAIAISGLIRTLTCGGWTYITSTDDHDWHDILMISYIVFTIPWTTGCIALSPPNAKAIKYRKYLAGGFFGTLVPLVYFFIQHKVHRVAGGKTKNDETGWRKIMVCFFFVANADSEMCWQHTRSTPSSSGPLFSSTSRLMR